MSDLRIDTTNIIGDLIPDVYIENVILETSGPGVRPPGNPHAAPGPEPSRVRLRGLPSGRRLAAPVLDKSRDNGQHQRPDFECYF